MIVDIQISLCNRYMASASHDGCVIIWDLEDLSIINKRTNDHSDQVNKVEFVMIECSQAQAEKNYHGSTLKSQLEKATSLSQVPTIKEDYDLRSYLAMYQSTNYWDDSEFCQKTEKLDKFSKNRSKSAVTTQNGSKKKLVPSKANVLASGTTPTPRCYD